VPDGPTIAARIRSCPVFGVIVRPFWRVSRLFHGQTRIFPKMKTLCFPALVLALIVGLAVGCYWPGLDGGFLFDDYHNLDALGTYGGVRDWETFRAFVFNGISGPTGRPLALLSFLLNDNTWPSHAAWFKPTNLAIHLLCGLLLCWCSLLLLRNFWFEEREAQWMAVFSSACWLLHPLMVSTTLYVVQRMAQLAVLFVFAGMAGYLYGRALLPTRPRAAYVWMTLSVGLGTLLAVLSKENGALLPLLLLVVEFCLPRQSSKARPAAAWRAVCLLLPSLAIVFYLASRINFSPDAWLHRPFDQPQRLLSETRILWEYLRLLFIPEIEGHGLFQDGYVISRGWLTPWTTLPSALGLLALFCAALWLRRRWPLAALAILFFFAGHLIESTVVALELYFEHRNYLAAAFLFLPLAHGLVFLARKYKPALAFIGGGLILCLLAGFTLQRALLWRNTDQLTTYWAVSDPNSARGQNSLASMLVTRGRFEEGKAHLEAAIERHPESALLNLNLLLLKVRMLQASADDFAATGQHLANQVFDAQAVKAIRVVVDKVIAPDSPMFYRDETLRLLDALDSNTAFARFHEYKKLSAYLKGRLYLAKAEPSAACQHYAQAVPLYADVEAVLMMVAELASANVFDCALDTLTLAEKILETQKDRSLRRPRQSYESEIKRLRETIDQEYWAVTDPNAPRGQNAPQTTLGGFEDNKAYLEFAVARHPDDSVLNLNLLLLKIRMLQATEDDFAATGRRLAAQAFDAQAVVVARAIVDRSLVSASPEFYRDAALRLLDAIDDNAAFARSSEYAKLSPYLRGRLYLAKAEPARACRYYAQAIPLHADVEATLAIVAELASANAFDCALTTLTLSEKILETQKEASLRQPRESYASEIKRLREIIDQEKRK
jgi:hypothetical protein